MYNLFFSITMLFAPLLSSLYVAIRANSISRESANRITIGAMIVSFISVVALGIDMNSMPYNLNLLHFINIGELNIFWSIYLDSLSYMLCIIVIFISLIVHYYSVGYMDHEEEVPRYMSYISFFTFVMLLLVTADNFIQMFVGWEGVGAASYLLIGFYYKKEEASQAALKAFIVNRVADIGFIVAMALIFYHVGSLNFLTVFHNLPDHNMILFKLYNYNIDTITVICLLLLIGAMGKSAQVGFHVWLPDAMAGPTPVSALIHAATMVTAGVYMIALCSYLFELSSLALDLIVIIGAKTALLGAILALFQNDIKKIIAYSTCSQLGYMFMACGASAYNAAIFHLYTHAFFKALLFLSAGSVIHSLNGEQDIRNMGNLRKNLPCSYLGFIVGSLAISGLYPFAGFYSKEMILENLYQVDGLASSGYYIALLVVFLTTLYSAKILIMVFHGKSHIASIDHRDIKENSRPIVLSLILLMICSVFAGFIGEQILHFGHVGHESFWRNSLFIIERSHAFKFNSTLGTLIATCLIFAGIFMAYMIYYRNVLHKRAYIQFAGIINILENKCYIDEIYNFIIVRSIKKIAYFTWKIMDDIICNAIVSISTKSVLWVSLSIKRLNNGHLQLYISVSVFFIFITLYAINIVSFY